VSRIFLSAPRFLPSFPLFVLPRSFFLLLRTRSLLSRVYRYMQHPHAAAAAAARARTCVSRSACASISPSVPRPPPSVPTGRCQFLVDHRLARNARSRCVSPHFASPCLASPRLVSFVVTVIVVIVAILHRRPRLDSHGRFLEQPSDRRDVRFVRNRVLAVRRVVCTHVYIYMCVWMCTRADCVAVCVR